MRIRLALLAMFAATAGPAAASGIMVPKDKEVPPLTMVRHIVSADMQDQVVVTSVEQTFRNHTDRILEATYLFPIPRGASVNKFAMWVDGKETSGELLDAKQAHQVYTDIVRRTQDPGLLEYLGNDLMRLRIFPVPPKGDQKVKVTFTSIGPQDSDVVEYTFPIKTDGKMTRALEEFSVKVSIKSQHPIANVYSPTHAVTVNRKGEREVAVEFEKSQAILDKDFQLFYGVGKQEIGLTPLLFKPVTKEDGYFMLLVSPQTAKDTIQKRIPRDMVMVLDTSSSMSDIKMSQAKKALKYCLSQLEPGDRFGLVRFSTSPTKYRDNLVAIDSDQRERAEKWLSDLRPGGGTAIWPALEEALAMRTDDSSRSFTIVFFTDGLPTVDETNIDKIVKNVAGKNSANTRIFTFGVGDDVNASMLDQLADNSRGLATYVRPAEDIETKVASLYGKISHPVMTDVKITAGDDIKLVEMYPPKLPDLFHGNQLVVIGRYTGSGHTAVKLVGNLAGEKQELVYDLTFPTKTEDGKGFVEDLWARRKVGYLLDQIRANGESKELVDEVTNLAKKYGIATPYTSYLVVPDGPMPVVPPTPIRPIRPPFPGPRPVPFPGPISGIPPIGGGIAFTKPAMRTTDFAKSLPPMAPGVKGPAAAGEAIGAARGAATEQRAKEMLEALKDEKGEAKENAVRELRKLQETKATWDGANAAFKRRDSYGYQGGKLGVDLSLSANCLREQQRVSQTANRQVAGKNCLEVDGIWVDDSFKADMKTVVVKAQSDAYFRILEKHPAIKDVYKLGNQLIWVTPSNCALIVDAADGKEKLDDAEIDALFASK